MSADIKHWLKTKAKNVHLQNPFGYQPSPTPAACIHSYEFAKVNSSTADWINSKISEEKNAEILGPKTPLNKLERRSSYPRDPSAEYFRMENAGLNDEINELRAAIHANVHCGRSFKPSHISMKKSQATENIDNNVFDPLATSDNDNDNDNDNGNHNDDADDSDNDANDEKVKRIRFSYPTQEMAAAAERAGTNIYYATFKNEFRWFLLMLFSYLVMCIPINVVVLVLVGWRPFFYRGMWVWSGPGFLTTIICGHLGPYLKPDWSRRRAYFRPNFPCRLRVYWAITAVLSFLIITFLLGRHFLVGIPSQLTTSPEAILPSTLGLDCDNDNNGFTAAADEKVASNQSRAADEVVAHFANALSDDDKAKEKMHKCIKEILDDADEAKKRMKDCEGFFFVFFFFLLTVAAPIVGLVDYYYHRNAMELINLLFERSLRRKKDLAFAAA